MSGKLRIIRFLFRSVSSLVEVPADDEAGYGAGYGAGFQQTDDTSLYPALPTDVGSEMTRNRIINRLYSFLTKL